MVEHPRHDEARDGDERPTNALDALRHAAGVDPQVSLPPDDDSAAAVLDPTSVELGSSRRTEQYQLLGEVARGGVGIILRGHDVDLGRDVAMKVLRPDHADRPAMIQRFIEEAQIGGQLQHPGIVPVYELGVREDGRPFFTMKLIKGRTLSQVLAESESEGEAGRRRRLLSLFSDVCQTVAYAHSKGVVHRDLKPANIMVGAFGEVLVVDWGLAKVLARGGDDDPAAGQTLQSQVSIIETIRSADDSRDSDSLSGSVLGTPAYMAPEQARGEIERVDQRADVFSLGCILCEILTGAPPYPGPGREVLQQAAAADLQDAFARLAACDADPELVRLCRAALAPAVSARLRHAGELAGAVDAYLVSVEERARQAALDAAGARQKRRLTLFAAAAALVIVGGLWWTSAQQAARVRRTDTAIERRLGEVDVLLAGADGLDAALAVLDEADAVARAGSVSPAVAADLGARRVELEQRLEARRFLDELDAIASAAAAAADVELSNETPVDTLDAERRDRLREQHARFSAAFARLGADLLAMPLEDAVSLVRASSEVVELCQGLDAWAATCRGLGGSRDGRARKLLQIALAADPHPERLNLRQALLALDVDELRRLADEADPALVSAVTARLLASSLVQLEAPDAAVDLLRQVLRVQRTDLGLNLLLARALERVGRIEEAVAPLYAARALDPGRLPTLLVLGEAHLAAGDFGLAEQVLGDAVALAPESCEPWLRLGQVHGIQGRADEALADFERAVELEPGREDAWRLLAMARFRRGGRADELAVLREGAARAGDDVDVLVAVAAGMEVAFRMPPAEPIALLERALAIDPERTDAWRNLAGALERAGELDAALSAFDEALARDPGHVDLRIRRARVRALASGRPRDALPELLAVCDVPEPHADAVRALIVHLERILDEEGEDADLPEDAWLALARSERALTVLDLDRAESHARDAVRRAPDLWATRWQLAYVLGKRRGKRDEAIDAYEQVIPMRPDHLFARTNIAVRLIEAGDLAGAERHLRRGVGYARNPVRLAHLGEVFWRLGRQDDARRLFAEAGWREDMRNGVNDLYAARTMALCLAIDAESPRTQLVEARRLAYEYANVWADRDDAHVVLGLVHMRLGELSLARSDLERAAEMQTDGVTPLTALLRALVELRDGGPQDAGPWLREGAEGVESLRVRDPFVLALVNEAAELLDG